MQDVPEEVDICPVDRLLIEEIVRFARYLANICRECRVREHTGEVFQGYIHVGESLCEKRGYDALVPADIYDSA